MTKKEVLKTARQELGTYEDGENRVKYNAWYYGRDVSGADYAWCMVFVQWVFNAVGSPLTHRTASCANMLDWWKQNNASKVFATPEEGDIVIYSGHTGIVERVYSNGDFDAIEGNYSNMVKKVYRKKGSALAFLRPNYEPESVQLMDKIEDVPDWARATVQKLVSKGTINGTGSGLGLSNDFVRLLVVLDREGCFDN